MTGYARQDTSNNIANGNVVDADDLDSEFNAVEGAFNSSTGHNHGGTSGEGAPILVVGPAQDIVTTSTQMAPKTTNAYDLGSASTKWKDLYVDGVAYVDNINLSGTAITSTAAELNILDGVTATASELNVLDGITASTAELNVLDGITATVAELNVLDGITATVTELNYVDGVTSSIQTQLNAKQTLDAGLTSISGLTTAANKMIYTTASDVYAVTDLTAAGRALLDDASAAAQLITLGLTATAAELNVLDGITSTVAELNILDGVTATAAELNVLDGITASTAQINHLTGVTSAIQTQLNNKQTLDAGLTSIAGLTTSANKMIYTTSSDTYAVTDLTTAGRALLDDASAAAQLITLGLTATASELNILDGATLTTTELNYVDGVTSSIQTQLNAKLSADLASQAEAEAGTNNTKVMTPLRVRNALNATGSAPVYACRAWVHFDGVDDGEIYASGNVASVVQNGVGDFTVTFVTAMPDDNYSVSGASNGIVLVDGGTASVKKTSTQVRFSTFSLAGNRTDYREVSLQIFR
jgi:hypothetical protein